MISFDSAHRAVHYPPDRRFRLWIRPPILIGTGIAILSVIAVSWIEVVLAGLPHLPAVPQIYLSNFAGPHGFPVWVRYCHFFNFLFVMMLIRSGLSILLDHPHLYFNDGCTPRRKRKWVPPANHPWREAVRRAVEKQASRAPRSLASPSATP